MSSKHTYRGFTIEHIDGSTYKVMWVEDDTVQSYTTDDGQRHIENYVDELVDEGLKPVVAEEN